MNHGVLAVFLEPGGRELDHVEIDGTLHCSNVDDRNLLLGLFRLGHRRSVVVTVELEEPREEVQQLGPVEGPARLLLLLGVAGAAGEVRLTGAAGRAEGAAEDVHQRAEASLHELLKELPQAGDDSGIQRRLGALEGVFQVRVQLVVIAHRAFLQIDEEGVVEHVKLLLVARIGVLELASPQSAALAHIGGLHDRGRDAAATLCSPRLDGGSKPFVPRGQGCAKPRVHVLPRDQFPQGALVLLFGPLCQRLGIHVRADVVDDVCQGPSLFLRVLFGRQALTKEEEEV
mmetsp:Transcript_100253/g.288025  ORF Transcript_100253/g.288025 Transcript_100253/m.288025 type:complete len:287 (+) Transcript_100253:2157-3017(+)